jgi:hypothetical protein
MSQGKRILEFLETGQTLKRTECWEKLGILEAPARISELRAKGHDIKTKLIKIKNRYGETVRIAEWSL